MAALTLLDPVMTLAPIPLPTMLMLIPMGLPGVPEAVRRRVLRWIVGGAQVELWPHASHAINGEYPGEIAEFAAAVRDKADG